MIRNSKLYLTLKCIFTWLPVKQTMTNMKACLSQDNFKKLDDLVTLKCRAQRLITRSEFIINCIRLNRFPHSMKLALVKAKLQFNKKNFTRLCKSKLEDLKEETEDVNTRILGLSDCVDKLTLVHRIRFIKYLRFTLQEDKKRVLETLEKDKTNSKPTDLFPADMDRRVLNLSNHTLSDNTKEALSLGINYGIHPRPTNDIQIESAFENLMEQCQGLHPTSDEMKAEFKTSLVNQSNQFRSSQIRETHLLTKEHMKALKDLRENAEIKVIRPDKGKGVVIMNKKDYVEKMLNILNDRSKFTQDNGKEITDTLASRIREEVTYMEVEGAIDAKTAQQLRPSSYAIPLMYGLPKTHKEGTPLRPILAMNTSPVHPLAKWLVTILQPLRDSLANYITKDSFHFADEIKDINVANQLMVSYDVQSLFTNIPLEETIDLIIDAAEQKLFPCPTHPTNLRKLLELCTKDVQFQFDGELYRQTEGVSMGSPLGPILADIFLGHLENTSLKKDIQGCRFYKRYVDDIFLIVKSRSSSRTLLHKFNNTHPNLKFTSEHENDNKISFLDILLTRSEEGNLVRNIYHKPTWTPQFLHFTSFVPFHYKVGLIKSQFFRIKNLCSQVQQKYETDRLKKDLMDNAYPEKLIQSVFRKCLDTKVKPTTAEKKPIFLRLPFKGDFIMRTFRNRIESCLSKTYYAAKLVLLHQTSALPINSVKEQLPMMSKSNVIYKFTCVCSETYVGRTSRKLSTRVLNHIPRWLERGETRTTESAIAQHLMTTKHTCNVSGSFTILTSTRWPSLLPTLEAVSIRRLRPPLCRQKKHVKHLLLPWS